MNVEGPKGEPIRIAEVVDTLGHERGAQRYSVIVAGPLDWLEDRIEKFRNRLTVALALAGIGLVAVTLFQVRFGLLPLRKIERGLAAVRSGEAQKLGAICPPRSSRCRSSSTPSSNRTRHLDVDRPASRQPGARTEDTARRHHQRGAGGEQRVRPKVTEQAQIMRDQVTTIWIGRGWPPALP